MATSNLGLVEVTAAQTQKEVTINNALEKLDQATQGNISITITANRVLTATEFTENFFFNLGGSSPGAFNLDLPATGTPTYARFFCVRNNTGSTATVRANNGSGGTDSLATGTTRLYYSDGTNLFALT
jgi:hypothetical protein